MHNFYNCAFYCIRKIEDFRIGVFMKDLNNKEINENSFIEKLKSNKLVEKLLSIPLIKKLFTKEVLLYAVFGVFTTIVNIGSFYILTTFFHISENLANNIAIILAVIFAYITNKDLVFHSQADGFGEKFVEFCRFILGRLVTMFIESIGGSLLFEYVPIPSIISKCLITIVVIILNFFISKFFAFKTSSSNK